MSSSGNAGETDLQRKQTPEVMRQVARSGRGSEQHPGVGSLLQAGQCERDFQDRFVWPEKNSRPRSRIAWLAMVCLAVIVVGCGDKKPPEKAGTKTTDGGNAGATPQLTGPERCAQLEYLKNRGIGQLENTYYYSADRTFTELTQEVPEELLAWQNLAIARILILEKDATSEKGREKEDAGVPRSTRIEAADTAVQKVLQMAPQSPFAHLLAGRIYRIKEQPEQAAAEFKRMAELAGDDPAFYYELFDSAKKSFEDPEASEALQRQALLKLVKLRPTNLAVYKELLALQFEKSGEELADTINGLEPNLAWLATSSKDFTPLLASARESIAAKDWKQLGRTALLLSNLLKYEPAFRNDMERLKANGSFRTNLLDFVQLQFSEAFQKQCPIPPLTESATEVKFRAFPETQQPIAMIRGETNAKLAPFVDFAVADFDLDSRADLWLLGGGRLRVIGQPQEAMVWKEVAAAYDTGDKFSSLLVADLDNDFPKSPPKDSPLAKQTARQPKLPPGRLCHDVDLDVVVYGPGGVKVLRNDWDPQADSRKFVEVKQSAAFSGLQDVLAAAVADLDHDGDLDLAISSKAGVSLWLNRGDMTFIDIAPQCQLPPKDVQPRALLPLDWNRNLNTNVVLGGTGAQPAGLMENVVHGRFRWIPFEKDFAALQPAVSLAALESDGNGSWDVLAGGAKGGTLIQTTWLPSGSVRLKETQVFTQSPLRGLATLDFDNDGQADVVTWGETGLGLFRGEAGKLRDSSNLLKGLVSEPLKCVPTDVDGDGDQDLAVLTANGVTWLMNEGGNRNHWLTLRLRAKQQSNSDVRPNGTTTNPSGRVNYNGIGSIVEIRAGGRYQAQLVTGPEVHFGLGSSANAEIARIVWTNGMPRNHLDPKVDQEICEEQTLGGSCPYLYTWNGKKFEFVTDLLWNAPIGMLADPNSYVPYRQWEYLKVPGEKLAARDGKYVLQFTEELFEATYVDQVKLIAVDHPADVEIYSNEKVGSPELAKFQIHTVRQPRVPVAARDKHERDVLPIVSKTDGEFLRGYDAKICQGVTDEHYLELDLGKLDKPKQITLYLTGWIYPPTPSLRLALYQRPGPIVVRPPFIQVPDAQGNWKEVVPFMGFPGGKTKTIAVDLSKVFLTTDYRLRIVTSNEIYWDSAFFTVDESPATLTQTELPLAKADIHFRGYSRSYYPTPNSPELYDYDTLQTNREWPAMGGMFTRYGDVRELLTATDDRLVIIGAGDEITLEFDVPTDAPPPGWKRDFLIYNVGWDKDCDRNTVTGHDVEPLPFNAMSRYPYPPNETYPQSALHRETLKNYHTRMQDPRRFWRMLRP